MAMPIANFTIGFIKDYLIKSIEKIITVRDSERDQLHKLRINSEQGVKSLKKVVVIVSVIIRLLRFTKLIKVLKQKQLKLTFLDLVTVTVNHLLGLKVKLKVTDFTIIIVVIEPKQINSS